DQELTLHRHGRPEQVFMNLDYSPVPGEDGAPAGVLAVVVETTAAVMGERGRAAEHERLVKMYEQAPGLIAMLEGADHVFVLANAAYRDLVGDRDVVGKPVRAALPEVAGQGFVELLDRVRSTGQSYRGDAVPVWLTRTAGAPPEERFVDFLYQPLTGEDGAVTGIFVEGYDVTERVRVQNALRESEDHYRHAVELSPQVAWTATPDGQLDHVAPRWEEITGTSGLGASWGDAIHPDDLGPSAAAWGRAVATGEPYDIEHCVRLRDGRHHWMHSRAYPRRDAGGRIVKWYGTTEDVEERKAAEAGLRAAEAAQRAQAEELRAVLDAVPAGIWITHDPEAREIAGNARSHEFLRVPQGQNQSKGAPGSPTNHFRFLDAEGRELLPRDLPVQAAARGEPVTAREYRVAFEDGSHVDLLGNATPLHDAQGRPAGAVAAFVDITARKAAEAALWEESRVLETLNRLGTLLAGELDPERLVQSLTDAGVALTGARFGAFFHNDLDESGERLHLFALSGADRSAFEGLGGVRATGVIGPIFRNEGVLRSDDVTLDPRYGQNEPHRGMPRGHLPVRSYMGVPVASRGGEVLGGLFFGHPEPGRFTERHERLMAALAAQAAIALDNARLFQAAQRANETLEARVAQALAERAQAEEALRQSQKMEAIGQLTGGIAHDFNNLLTPIVGGLDIVRRRVKDERSERLLGGALQAAERAKTLVSRLLAFARRQTLQPRAVDVAELVDGLRDLIDRSLGPSIEVRLDLPPGLPPVMVDPNQLELALLNLSVNARDAMPGGGRLAISAEAKDASECSLPGILAPGPYLRLTVTDTGIGMDEATLARAVEPFFSTKGLGKGTGLGLSMVHGLAAQSGGLFKLLSRVGEGTAAVLWLPVAPEGASTERPAEAVAPRAPRPAVVLLVDDEPLVRLSTAEGLRELGYEVVEVGTAAEALEVLRVGLWPDIVVTDHMMPGMTGAQLATELRERVPDLPVLMITGYANLSPEQTRGLVVLSKPFRQADLATLLAQLLSGESRVVRLRPRSRPEV
ncbi:MAG TPA: PAS domain-containing protein, partial [Rubellimicrobium sp.]|nr:PAS domain-containing protein [Rubellimicrobium sp.]